MDELFSKYEGELVILRSLCREYAQRYPKVAAQLQLGGDACDDPHVERLIQAVALLCARVTRRLDDNYPQFTEALLDLLFPHYLRPFPSCAIVRVAAQGEAPIKAIPRGSRLDTRSINGVPCSFTTAYEVAPALTVLAGARFDAMIAAPSAIRLPAGAGAAVSLTFAAAAPNAALAPGAVQPAMRLYIDGDPSFCATLRDTLFMRTACAYVQYAQDGPWIRLPAVPLAQVGFAEEDALIPFGARSHLACRLLAEYFAFPDKFNFIDVDLAAVLARAPDGATRATLHLAVSDIRADADQARLLGSLSAANLLQGCTPVVNLFRQPGVPVSVDQRSADYTVLAHGSHPQAFEVYSVDRVHMVHQVGRAAQPDEFRPFYSLRHGEDDGRPARYWLMRHDETLAVCSPGHEKTLSLVDDDCEAFEVDRSVLSIDLTCTNRDLPCSLRLGAREGDLFAPGAAGGDTIRFLRRPTRPARLVNGADTQWRLISHLALNHHSLVQDSAALREMLGLYDLARSPVTRRQIGGIAAVDAVDSTAWIRHRRGSSLMHGAEVRVDVDEDAVIGVGLHLFAQVLDHFFGMSVHLNSFVELVILSRQSGKELLRCPARSGSLQLV